MPKTVFYAWQSDRPKELTREFIREAIVRAIERLNADAQVVDADDVDQLEIDHDTKDEPGSPPIAETICRKIRECAIFVADLTFVCDYSNDAQRKKYCVNGNVLIELGYARGKRGAAAIVTVQNTRFGKADDLPFDLRHIRHPIKFELSEGTSSENRAKRQAQLTDEFEAAFRTVLKTVVAAEEIQRAEKDEKRRNEISADHAKFVSEIRGNQFNGLVFNAALALSIIPLTKPTIPLDLAAEDRNIRSMMTPLSRTEWDSRCRARSVINFSVRRNSETNQQYRVSVAEVTDEGSIFAACDLPIVTSGADQRVVYFEKIERQLMLEAGQYMQLLVQRLKVNSPFVVGLSLINVHNVYLLSSAPFASDPSPISVANINPQSSIVCIDGDPADYSSVTSKFAAGLRVTMNEIWREAGQTKDHQYDINGEMFGH